MIIEPETTPNRMRWFIIVTVGAFITLMSLRFFVIPILSKGPIPSATTIFISIIDNLIIALAASVVVTAISSWLKDSPTGRSVIEVVHPSDISKALDDAYKGTNEWWYKGTMARYFRCHILPKISHDAKKNQKRMRIHLLIANPYNVQEIQETRGPDPVHRSEKDLKLELYATIVASYAYKAETKVLDIKIGLLDTCSIFRIDCSSKLALITTRPKGDPALRYNFGTTHYDRVLDDLYLSENFSKKLPSEIKFVPLNELSVNCVKNLFNSIDLNEHGLTDEEIEKVIKLAKRRDTQLWG